jgi:hypothetical protein
MESAYTVRVYAPEIAIVSACLSIGEIAFSFDGRTDDGLIFGDIILLDTDKPLSAHALRKAGFIGASHFWQNQLIAYFRDIGLPHNGLAVENFAEEIVRGSGPPWVPDVLTLEVELLPSAETKFFWSNRRRVFLPNTTSK